MAEVIDPLSFPVQAFIIQISLFGLGLLIAIYTLIYPKLEKILEKQRKEYNEKVEQLREKANKFGKGTLDEIKNITEELSDIRRIPFHLDMGILLTSIFFIAAALSSLFNLFFNTTGFFRDLFEASYIYLFFGIILFIIIWYNIFSTLRTFITEKFEEDIEKGEILEEEVKEKTRKAIKGKSIKIKTIK